MVDAGGAPGNVHHLPCGGHVWYYVVVHICNPKFVQVVEVFPQGGRVCPGVDVSSSLGEGSSVVSSWHVINCARLEAMV